MSNILDEFYNKYINEHVDDACKYFDQRVATLRAKGINVINEINNYLEVQSQDWKNYFVSSKVDKEYVKKVRGIVSAFDDMTSPIKYLIDDYYPNDYDYQYNDIESDLTTLTPHVAFNVSSDFLREAQKKYGYIDDVEFESLIKFIEYVKKNDLLNKMTEYGSWQSMTFEELIYKLCDKIKDKSIIKDFENFYYDPMEIGLFKKIKNNSLEISQITFDNYRPQLNSAKQMNVDFGKYIFCLNLKNYLKTGIMPDKSGLLYSEVEMSQKEEIIEDFKALYRQDLDSDAFKTRQANIIFQPEYYTTEYELWSSAKHVKDKQLTYGILFSSFHLEAEFCNCYLIHININDATNNQSTYEIQLNLIPDGNFDSRIQLVRLDNWEKDGAHKNVARKLKTRTHIHLYNELDILRGKTNGAYDIAFNLEDKSADFETSLKTFLNLLKFDNKDILKITNLIKTSISKIKNKTSETIVPEAEMVEAESVNPA